MFSPPESDSNPIPLGSTEIFFAFAMTLLAKFFCNNTTLHFVFSRFPRPASIALPCQPLHSSPVRSLSSPESIAAVLSYLPMLLFREVVLASRPSDRLPSANSCLRIGFFFIFASSHLDNLRDE